jgi:hypothetical protein
MNKTSSRLKKSIIRILLILLGSSIYWLGYYGFFTKQEGDFFTAGCLILIVAGLFIAGWNSFLLSRGK